MLRIRLSLAGVLAATALLASCGDGGGGANTTPAALDEFIESYARLYCEKLRQCDSWAAAYSQDECENLVVTDLTGGSAMTALESGALTLDADAAHACLELLSTSPACAADWSEEYCLEEGVIVGTVEAGGACDSDTDWLCAPGTVCSAERFSGACGVCQTVTLVGPGEPCSSTYECLQTDTVLTHCGNDPVDARDECLPWVAPRVAGIGESCDAEDVVCGVGSECDWNGDYTCRAQIALGQECDPNGDYDCLGNAPCVDDAASSLGGTCRTLVLARTAGASCGVVADEFVECSIAAGLSCNTTTHQCEANGPGTDGESCLDAPCGVGFRCNYVYPNPICIAQLADGETCDYGGDCLSGFCFGPEGSSTCGNADSVTASCAP